jgi:undecaprenyl-diphosphatase
MPSCAATPPRAASFVSGHVVLVTGLAWVVTPYLRGRWRIAPGIVVAIVAFARLYLGAHAPLDVLGGLGLGVAIGVVANVIVGVPASADAADPIADQPA